MKKGDIFCDKGQYAVNLSSSSHAIPNGTASALMQRLGRYLLCQRRAQRTHWSPICVPATLCRHSTPLPHTAPSSPSLLHLPLSSSCLPLPVALSQVPTCPYPLPSAQFHPGSPDCQLWWLGLRRVLSGVPPTPRTLLRSCTDSRG